MLKKEKILTVNLKIIKILFLSICCLISSSYALENKIILKISNEIITSLDIYKEINRLKFFNKEINKIDDEKIYNIAIESIIKTKIKKKEVEKYTEIKNNDDEYLKIIIKNSYEKLGFTDLDKFKSELINKNIDYKNYEETILVDIFWNQIIYSKYNDKIVIDENKLLNQIQNQNTSTDEYDLSEIIFQIESTDKVNQVFQLINKEIQDIGFANAALKYSVSSTAENGGKIGWVNENSLTTEILELIKKIEIGSITNPIRISSGFLILKKNNIRNTKKNLDKNDELKKLINFEKNSQLNNFSNLYFKKIKNDYKIYAP